MQATYEDAGLILRLYELRREEKLRTARAAISEVREGGVYGRGSGREKVGEGDEFEVRLISSDR